jgi:class 3 adenylate cyclase/tetratricopeptide (TPR) repeat protein
MPEHARSVESDVQADEPARTEADRRQLTVMFVDLVGSTELSGRLDPEDLRELMRDYQSAVVATVKQHDGYVANFLGDGVIAFFGWPNAVEDQAEQAVRAGLASVEAVGAIFLPGQQSEKLSSRVGIATGQVVIGDLLDDSVGQQGMVSGETPNLAARLQSAAAPGGVVIGDTTRALVRARFDLEHLGPQNLKGFSGPVDAWRVRAESVADSRFSNRRTELTPFIGRAHEVGLLRDRWLRVNEGEGQVIMITGDPGIGKSRIVQTFCDQIDGTACRQLHFQCSAHHLNSALHPVIRQLEHAAGIAAGDSEESKLDKLEALLRQSSSAIEESVPLFAALLSIPHRDRYGATDLAPQQQRNAILQALQQQLFGLSAQEPVLFILEDAHWIDPTTHDLIIELVPQIADRPIMMLISHRPEWTGSFHGQGHVTALNLTRLSRSEVDKMAVDIAGQELPSEAIAQIVERTDGVPLFVEELTKSVLETGFIPDRTEVPVTLQGSLMARLDRLGAAKEIAQIGAVIGREFDRQLLATVADIPFADLDAELDRLVHSQLVFRSGGTSGDVYSFKHALIQDVAYESLLRQRRQALHLAIAEALAADEGSGVAPEVLARHFERGGGLTRGLDWWGRAGDAAAARSAQPEAAAHYDNALRLLRAQDTSSGDDQRECMLLLRLGHAQLGAFGGGWPATIATFDKAAALASLNATPEVRILAQYGQWTSQIIAGHYVKAAAIADDMAKFVENRAADWMRAVPARPQATTLYQMGHPRPARQILEPIVDCVEHLSNELPAGFAHDPLLLVPAVLAHIEWALGERETAFARSSRLVETIGGKTTNPNSISHVYSYDMLLSVFARDAGRAREVAERLRDHTQRTGGFFWGLAGPITLGMVDVLEDRPEAALPKLTAGVTRYRASGAQQFLPLYMLSLAEAHHLNGDLTEALKILEETIAMIARTEQRFFEPETHRLRGVVLESLGQTGEAAAACRTAIAIADDQGSIAWRDRARETLASFRDPDLAFQSGS